jgi:hypothetical protein
MKVLYNDNYPKIWISRQLSVSEVEVILNGNIHRALDRHKDPRQGELPILASSFPRQRYNLPRCWGPSPLGCLGSEQDLFLIFWSSAKKLIDLLFSTVHTWISLHIFVRQFTALCFDFVFVDSDHSQGIVHELTTSFALQQIYSQQPIARIQPSNDSALLSKPLTSLWDLH